MVYDLNIIYKENNKDLPIWGYIDTRLLSDGLELELYKRRGKLLVL
jgi:hypothetical protein